MTFDKDRRKNVYNIQHMGSDFAICITTTVEESSKNEFYNTKLIDIPLYRLVFELGASDGNKDLDNLKILSEDKKFMESIDKMYKVFEKGYNKLMNLRVNSL
jgi:hypothetical protein